MDLTGGPGFFEGALETRIVFIGITIDSRISYFIDRPPSCLVIIGVLLGVERILTDGVANPY